MVVNSINNKQEIIRRMMLGSEVIVHVLYNLGVRDIFGYPGGYVLDIYEALRKFEKINHYLTISEQGAVFAADGYARSSNKLGVVLTTSGPGAINTVCGIATANMDSSALLVITGNVPTGSLGTDSFQEADIVGITMPITKYNHIVKHKEELINSLINAYVITLSKRKGAVLLDIPQDIQLAEYEISPIELELKCNEVNLFKISNDFSNILSASEIINRSKKIVILCGGGAKNSINETSALAEILNCPVITTLMGVQYFDNKKINYLGLCGSFGNPAANYALKQADTVITLGTRFGDRLTKINKFTSSQIIQIDIDKAEHDKNISAICFIKGQVYDILNRLMPLLNKKSDDFLQLMLRYKQKTGNGDNFKPLTNMLNYLSNILDYDSFVATDVGEHQMQVAKNYTFGANFLTSGGFGTMGWGLPALIGANIAKKPKKSLLITGDGSFNMSLNEFATAVKLKLPIIVFIVNNHSLGMCKTSQLLQYKAVYQTDNFTTINYSLFAESFGAKGYRVKNIQGLKRVIANYNFEKPIIIELDIKE